MRLIDADDLQKVLAEKWYESPKCLSGIKVSMLIDEQPTIEAAPVRYGRWKVWHHGVIGCSYSCTECGTSIGWPAEYCPGCGARMEE